jgi:hypothetical protein
MNKEIEAKAIEISLETKVEISKRAANAFKSIDEEYSAIQAIMDASYYWYQKGANEALSGIDLDQVVYVLTQIEGEEMPPYGDDNLYLLYDNGEIVRHMEEEQPFAICTHWLKKTTIRQLTSK